MWIKSFSFKSSCTIEVEVRPRWILVTFILPRKASFTSFCDVRGRRTQIGRSDFAQRKIQYARKNVLTCQMMQSKMPGERVQMCLPFGRHPQRTVCWLWSEISCQWFQFPSIVTSLPLEDITEGAGRLAQMVERSLSMREARGSIPRLSTAFSVRGICAERVWSATFCELARMHMFAQSVRVCTSTGYTFYAFYALSR